MNVQIFGVKNNQATRAAERFFKERGVAIHFVDLKQKAMAAGEIARFVQRFTLPGLVDTESSTYLESGLKYLKVSETELMTRIASNPQLLRLPLIRSANKIAIGADPESWKEMVAGVKK